MSDESYILQSHNDTSSLVAIFEDDGISAWLYLCGAGNRKPIADVWIHNRIDAPPTSEIEKYRGSPPPAAFGYSDDSTICHDLNKHEWTFAWRKDGDAVAIQRDGIPMAMLVASDRRGWSRNLLRNGPWGNVWDESHYHAIMEDGGLQ